MIHPNSRAAYDELDLGKRQTAVMEAYRDFGHGAILTDRQVYESVTANRRGEMNFVRPRITELIKKGLLEEKGTTKDHVTGRTVRLVGLPEKQVEAF